LPSKSRIPRGLRGRAIVAIGVLLFLASLCSAVALTLPSDAILSTLGPMLRKHGVDLSAQDARFVFPAGVRLSGVTLSFPGYPPVAVDEIFASFEWTGLFRWAPMRLQFRKGAASGDLRFSPAFWNPGSGNVLLSGVSSSDLPLSVFATPGAGFSIRRLEARWNARGGKVTVNGSGTLHFLQVPIPTPGSPIRDARIEGVSLSFLVRERSLLIPKLAGTFEGSQVDGTGEIKGGLSPQNSAITLYLRIQNPFEGRVGMLFDMLSKNAKNVNLRIVGTLAAPKGEFHFF
jgi:type II secretion system protein N